MISRRTLIILTVYAISSAPFVKANDYRARALISRPVRQAESKSEGPQLMVQLGHSSSVNKVALSADGKYMVTSSNDFTTKLWEVDSGRELRTFIGHPTPVIAVAVSADGKYLVTGGMDSTAKLWEMESGREVRAFVGHSKAVYSVAMSADGKYLATGSWDETAKLWDVESGKQLRTFAGHSEAVASVALSVDGKYLVTGSEDNTAKLWEVESGKEVRTFTGHSESLSSVALSMNGKYLVTGSADHTAKLWEVESGKEVRSFAGHSKAVYSIALSADGKHLVTGSGDKTAKLWEVETGKEVRAFTEHSEGLSAVAMSANGKYLVTASDTAKLWEVESGKEVRSFIGHSEAGGAIALSADGKYMVTGSQDARAKLWQVASGKQVLQFIGHSASVAAVAFSADGKYLVTGSADTTAKLWEVESGREVRSFTGHLKSINSIALSADGKYLVTGSDDTMAKVWEVASGKELGTFTVYSSSVTSVAITADDNYIVTGHGDDTAKLWDVKSGRKLRSFTGHSSHVASVALTADGKYLVTGSSDGTARLWEVESGKQLRVFDAYIKVLASVTVNVSSVVLSTDGKYLVTGSWDRSAKLWEVATGREVRTFIGHSGPVDSVALSADGKYLVTRGFDSVTRIWDLQSGRELCRLLSFVDGNWAVVAPDGRFDASSLEEIKGLYWIMPDDPMRTYPLEIFMRDYYEPRLMPRILAGERFKPIQSIATLNRVQPRVAIAAVTPHPGQHDLATVSVKIAKATGEFKQGDKKITRATEVYDLRLFRDGQLVAQLPQFNPSANDPANQAAATPEQTRKEWREQARVKLDANGEQTITFKDIHLPRRADTKQVEFSAYAFNEDRVKSQTDKRTFEVPKDLAPVKGRAYLLTVGVNAHENRAWNLRFAAKDARLAQQTLYEGLKRSGEFADVINMPLISDAQPAGGARPATKANVKTALEEIARQARPEDLVMIYYASHGYADQSGNYYFFTSDTGPGKEKVITPELLRHSISSDELSAWLKDVDAGEIALIIDACQSAGTVKGEAGGEFKPGPMGSRGLGQLAYDKRMRILAASQADESAFETASLQHGLLTYALMKDGIEGRKADLNNDGLITLTEALTYTLGRVPKLYEALQRGELAKQIDLPKNRPRKAVSVSSASQKFQQPALFDFAKTRREIVLVR